MRSFNADFITEKNKRADGPKPINLLTFGFATPAYISDRDVTPSGGSAHQGIVKSWGFVDTSIKQTPGSGVLGSIEIADLQLTLINSTSPRFSDNFTDADPPENVIATLYQWFEGLADSKKEIIFKGVITGLIEYDEYICTLTVRGIFDKYNKQIGEDLLINPVDFPDADPDEYGKMQNIIYGSCPNVPCHAIVSGDVNSLAAAITAGQTSIELSDSSYFPASGVVGIDAEQISYTGNAANTLTGCTRGYNSTTAVTHDAGAPCWEELAAFVYLVAGHPVKSIGDVYVDGVRVTSIATKYTGQTGDEMAGWEGKAVFTVPSRLTRQQAIDLILTDGIAVVDGIGVVDGAGVSDTIGVSKTGAASKAGTVTKTGSVTKSGTVSKTGSVTNGTIGAAEGSHGHPAAGNTIIVWKFETAVAYAGATVANPANAIDSNFDTYARVSAWTGSGYLTVTKQYYEDYQGVPKRIRICLKAYAPSGIVSFTFAGVTMSANNTTTPQKGDWTDLGASYDTWAEINAASGLVSPTYPAGSGPIDIYEVWAEIEYEPTIEDHAATGVAVTGSISDGAGVSDTIGVSDGAGVSDTIAVNDGAGISDGISVSDTIGVSRSGAASKTGSVTKSGAATKSGTVTLSGNSVADVLIGTIVTANIDGYQDDGAGTYTGTPDALIERPDHVFKHLWGVILSAPSADIDSASFTAAGAFYAANSYSFAMLIKKLVSAADLLMRLALQCRSRFLVTAYGTAKLFVRQLGQASGHAIAKNEIKRDSVSIERSPSSEIINLLNLCYELDLTRDAGDDQAYYGVWNIQNATSIARYGQREWKGDRSLFLFDAVRDADMAEEVGLYLVDYHMQARKMPKFGVFLDNMEIEPGDIIDITHPLDAMSGFTAEVQKLLHHIGNTKQIDYVEVIAVEN